MNTIKCEKCNHEFSKELSQLIRQTMTELITHSCCPKCKHVMITHERIKNEDENERNETDR